MKARLFVALVLTVGMALLLAWAVAAQETTIEVNGPSALYAVSTNHVIPHPDRQNMVSLDYTLDITFTPAFTIYLPATFKNYGGCTTIPTLISPTNGGNLDTIAPLFRWDNGNNPNATMLRLEVAKNPGFTQTVWSLWSGGTSGVREFRFSENLDPATVYYWRAWLMCGDTQGPYSEVWSFTTGSGGTILPAPALVAPANGSAVPTTTVTLQWSSVSGAIEYLVHWREVGQGGYTWRRVNDTQTTISWLSVNTTYEWWISARNDYAIGTDSEKWQFTTPAGSLSSPSVNYDFVLEDGSTHHISDTRQ